MDEAKAIPPKPELCAVCGATHDANVPHNKYSAYYRAQFYAKHKRFPTWQDAMAHCSEEMKEDFTKVLQFMGLEEEG